MFICLSILGGDSVGLFMFKIRIKITIQSNPIHIFHWWKWRYLKIFRVSPWSPINVIKKCSLGGAIRVGLSYLFLSAADLFKPCFWLSFSTFFYFSKCEKIVSDKDILEIFLKHCRKKWSQMLDCKTDALIFFVPWVRIWVWGWSFGSGMISMTSGWSLVWDNLTCDRWQQNRIEGRLHR